MSYLGPSQTGIADALKAFLFTIDPSFDSKDLTLESLETVLPAILANQSISSSTMTQFKDTFYPDADTVRAQGNKTLERIKSQNLQENFKNAKILFIIAKALYSKLRRDAQARAAQDAFNKKVEKYLRLRKAGNQLALGRYWEELAEFDRIGEEQLLELIKRQHQEAMEQLRGLQETRKILKRQLKEIDQYKEQVLDFHAKEMATDLKKIKFKDGTSPFEGVSDETMEKISKEYIEKRYEATKKIEQQRQELDEMKQQKATLEKQIKEDAQSSASNSIHTEKKTHSNHMGGLGSPPTMLTFKRHKEHMQRSENAHPLSGKLKALNDSIAQREENLLANLNLGENLLSEIMKKYGIKKDSLDAIESNAEEFRECIKNVGHDEKEISDELDFCHSTRKEITGKLEEIEKTGKTFLKEQIEILAFHEETAKFAGGTESLLETFKKQAQELNEFDFDNDEEELELDVEIKEKTRPRMR